MGEGEVCRWPEARWKRPVTDPQALFPETPAHCRPKVIPSQEWNFSRRHPLQTPIEASLPVFMCFCVARSSGPLWDALICRELEACLPGEAYLQGPHLKPCFAKGKNCGIDKPGLASLLPGLFYSFMNLTHLPLPSSKPPLFGWEGTPVSELSWITPAFTLESLLSLPEDKMRPEKIFR